MQPSHLTAQWEAEQIGDIGSRGSMLKRTYYVYELSNPRGGELFYIGKGTSDRCTQHERQAIQGNHSAKCRRIRDILKAGYKYRVTFLREFSTEKAAYAFEKRHIEKHGLDKLTNIVPGGQLEWLQKSDPLNTRVEALIILAQKSFGFKASEVTFLGHKMSFPIQELREAVGDIISQRSIKWLNKRLKRHNLVLEDKPRYDQATENSRYQ